LKSIDRPQEHGVPQFRETCIEGAFDLIDAQSQQLRLVLFNRQINRIGRLEEKRKEKDCEQTYVTLFSTFDLFCWLV
jgi:hypothetical protein